MMRSLRGICTSACLLALGLVMASCAAGYRAAYEDELEGIASYYADEFNGRRTSNGEVFDMHAMTAAHKTLPFHSIVRVTNLDNQRSVEVRINDRGPFKDGRVIDLSYAAALELGMVTKGLVPVVIDILELGPSQ